MIAAFAIQSHTAFIYIRGEMVFGTKQLERAAEEAYRAGLIGKNIFGSGYDLELIVHRGAGAYICGEETALLSSLEGGRGWPKVKPPFPATHGLFGCPTVVNNVETLAALPWIIERGAAAYAAMGTEKSKGTKLFSVSGHITRPGVYEVEMGYPFKKFLEEDCGGVRQRQKIKRRDSRRRFDAGVEPGRDRKSKSRLRVGAGGGQLARLGRRHRHGRDAPAWCARR